METKTDQMEIEQKVDDNSKKDALEGKKKDDVETKAAEDITTKEAIFKTSIKEGTNIYSCAKCGKNYKKISGVRNHFINKHGESKSDTESTKDKKRLHSSDSEDELEESKKTKNKRRRTF